MFLVNPGVPCGQSASIDCLSLDYFFTFFIGNFCQDLYTTVNCFLISGGDELKLLNTIHKLLSPVLNAPGAPYKVTSKFSNHVHNL